MGMEDSVTTAGARPKNRMRPMVDAEFEDVG